MHSIYFEVLGEHGWIGLTIFLSLVLTALLTCSRIVKLWRDRPDLKWASDLAKMMQVCPVGYAAAGTFLNLATFDLFYHILTIIFLLGLLWGRNLCRSGQCRNLPMRVPPSRTRHPVPRKSPMVRTRHCRIKLSPDIRSAATRAN